MYSYLVDFNDGDFRVMQQTPDGIANFAKNFAEKRQASVSVYAGSDGKHLADYLPDGSVEYKS